ncbi:MAG: inositol monophosphatase [Anaerolineae bacterium]|nr:inositol monophosphatase [Anaerolineae bacterium]
MELQEILAKVEPMARQAGAILKEHFGKPEAHTKKGDVDLLSEADKASEAYLLAVLKEAFSAYAVIGEEGSDYHPGAGAPDYYWYIDPLDGTTNFVHGLPHFSVSIALAGIDRRPVLGVVYDPLRDECFTAYQGGGAFLNGQPLRVSQAEKLVDSLVVTGFPYDRRTSPENNLKAFNAMLLRAQGVRRIGSAALDLAYVAAGRLDGYWEMKLHMWDCYAGIVLVQEAGGRVTDYRESEQLLYQKHPQVLATNGKIHNEMSVVLVTAR